MQDAEVARERLVQCETASRLAREETDHLLKQGYSRKGETMREAVAVLDGCEAEERRVRDELEASERAIGGAATLMQSAQRGHATRVLVRARVAERARVAQSMAAARVQAVQRGRATRSAQAQAAVEAQAQAAVEAQAQAAVEAAALASPRSRLASLRHAKQLLERAKAAGEASVDVDILADRLMGEARAKV